MIHLPEALAAWGSPEFKSVLKRELERLAPGQLPLQQGLSASSYALDEPVTAVVVGLASEPGRIGARVGVFYSGVIAGCSCADDPTPVEAQNEYCELMVTIDPATAEARIELAPEAEEEA